MLDDNLRVAALKAIRSRLCLGYPGRRRPDVDQRVRAVQLATLMIKQIVDASMVS